MEIKRGASRLVILVGSLALKVPDDSGPERFELGRNANCAELNAWRETNAWWHKYLCPVIYADPDGGFLVMRRARMMTVKEHEAWRQELIKRDEYRPDAPEEPYEEKLEDWGYLDNQPVAVDYARVAYFTAADLSSDPGRP